MGFPINGDLVPSTSGFANLGVDVGPNAQNAFDITSLRPFNHIHQISGIFHDPLYGQSGVLRYSRANARFEVSVDGGATFVGVRTTASAGVDSIGVIGDANLSGDVDLATRASGFMVIEDVAGSSPLIFSVDTLGLSGLWGFPTQGFNGRVVNVLTDFHGTEAQGVINLVGASGIIADLVGQTFTIAADRDLSVLTSAYAETFGAATSWVATHNLNTTDVSVMVLDDSSPRVSMIPDELEITDANNVTVRFNVAQGGRIVIVGVLNG